MLLLGPLLLLFLTPFAHRTLLAGSPRLESIPAAEAVDGRADPRQEPLSLQDAAGRLDLDGREWELRPRATYRIAARVLAAKQYADWQAEFAPIDLALGWGALSDPGVDRWIRWRQADRWYFYTRRATAPLSKSYVRDHTANVHLIPATENVRLALQKLTRNDLVLLEGLLVDVKAEREGQTYLFRTSLTREDEGQASCEIMLVERMVVRGREYR